MRLARPSALTRTLALFSTLALAGCPAGPTPDGDAGPGSDAGDPRDAGPGPSDAGPSSDGGADRDGGVRPPPADLVITTCPGDALPSLASGVCEATAGDGNVLYTGDVLTPGEVFRGGQVLVDTTGTITCVGCDCSGAAGAAGATRVTCPDGAISPGLINAHEHLSFQGVPYTNTGERYDHRHEWRRGLPGHTRIGSTMGTQEQTTWAELRMALGGATSINGSGGRPGLLRNLDRGTVGGSDAMEGLGQDIVLYDTFPLDDAAGTVDQLRTADCMYGTGPTTTEAVAAEAAYTPHIAEGIGAAARNEFRCTNDAYDYGTLDLVQDQTAIIHGVALLARDVAEVALDRSMLIWSPRSNITLYGETARVTVYDTLGVPIALGTDWVFTGSMNMLRELACADSLNTQYFSGHFSDRDLWLMATRNPAIATASDDVIGVIAVGHVADLAIFDARTHRDFRAVIAAAPEDVALVVRGGRPLLGEASVVPNLPMGAGCEALDVCGAPRQVCVMRETGMSLAALTAANASSYALFFCGADPSNEPSCAPAYPGRWTGLPSAEDGDGDAVPDATDVCPMVFDPIRPLDGDAQADADADGLGDACDPCPFVSGASCSSSLDGDLDGDGIANLDDTCPYDANPGNADADGDGRGDVCDACPDTANRDTVLCPPAATTIYEVQNGTVPTGTTVTVQGVVTGVMGNGLYLQMAPDDPATRGAEYAGVFVFTSARPTVAVGDRVSATGDTLEYFTLTEVAGPATVTRLGTAPLPTPATLSGATIAGGDATLEPYESVLVTFGPASVTNAAPTPGAGDTAPTNEFEVTGPIRVDDQLFRVTPLPSVGATFSSLTGVVVYRNGFWKLLPRSAADLVP